ARWTDFPIPEPGAAEIPADGDVRGVVVAGDGDYDRGALLDAAEALGFPVLATALSGLRGLGVISGYHHLLSQGVPEALRPELVIGVGSLGPSRRLDALVSAADTRIRIDHWGRSIDPDRDATHRLHADPVATLQALVGRLRAEPGWGAAWREAEDFLEMAVVELLADSTAPTGALVARALNEVPWEALVVASSLPVREVDAHLRRTGPVLANRGASGIDGFVSTALGVASLGRPTVALAGDLSLFHDCNGFLAEGDDDLVVVVVDNGGGGLFDDLPQAEHAPWYERLFVTPHGRDLSQLARLHALGYDEVAVAGETAGVVTAALAEGGRSVVRVPIDRETDRQARRALDEVGARVASSVQA
ncbi:MAG TPA: 2-succinyl-5-enolpyruvyl-6-hydroxy-3-cyclohexene-1-carboxylate synthase, partial [Acidimicrobiia bacterium]|nr:2-succinyl-5-enolpyruvyl-6-hydroxy-3-cyclohexene-1-carboxylate synthase [Acidimicrobiia bacterium]